MKSFHLEKPSETDENAVASVYKKWKQFGGRMNPGLLRLFNGNYQEWMQLLSGKEKGSDIGDEVPQSFYLLKDSTDTILGAVAIRYYLNSKNIVDGGHVGYGICPEFRGKGYGNLILALALQKMQKMGIRKVLVTCDADNTASQKVIVHNGGILENQTFNEDGIKINRYWIDNTVRNTFFKI